MEIRIPGFTLCKELQETILSIQAECKQIAAESSALLDDFVHHSSSDEVQIIQNPNIAYFPPCLVVEERPPSPKAKKRKTHVFVSTLPRRRTRSARSTEAAVGWKNMEQEIPILHPLSSIVKEVTVTQEPVPSNNMTVTQEPTSSQNLVVTQEPTAQEETVPQEPVMPELVVTQEPTIPVKRSVPQEPELHKIVRIMTMCHLLSCFLKLRRR
jgi:hypothetical protein